MKSEMEKRLTILRSPPAADSDWLVSKSWADQYIPDIEKVVQKALPKLIVSRIEASSKNDDQLKAIDYIIHIQNDQGKFGCRIRNEEAWERYRDFTFRALRYSGVETELSKIEKGELRWYLYAWGNGISFLGWAILDLDRCRHKLRPLGTWQRNKDYSSAFICIRPEKLSDAIIDCSFSISANFPGACAKCGAACHVINDPEFPGWTRRTCGHGYIKIDDPWLMSHPECYLIQNP